MISNELLRKAESGDSKAMFDLALQYSAEADRLGEGFEGKNNNAQWDWMKKAVKHGNEDAKKFMIEGALYALESGQGEKGMIFLEYIANYDFLMQFYVAEFYRKGEGIPVDLSKATYWYKQAAKNGNTDAQEILRNNNISW